VFFSIFKIVSEKKAQVYAANPPKRQWRLPPSRPGKRLLQENWINTALGETAEGLLLMQAMGRGLLWTVSSLAGPIMGLRNQKAMKRAAQRKRPEAAIYLSAPFRRSVLITK
jgi:hypothetical protein